MLDSTIKNLLRITVFLCALTSSYIFSQELSELIDAELTTSEVEGQAAAAAAQAPTYQPHIINDIMIVGNKYIETEAIRSKVPFKKGDEFDPSKTGPFIKQLYGLGYFDQINVLGEALPNNQMNLYVAVQEGKRIDAFVFEGNDNLGEKLINEKLKLDTIKTMHPMQLKKMVAGLKKLYREKDYHLVEITPEYKEHDGTVTIVFHIDEGVQSFIKRVYFVGNRAISAKELRGIIFTREQWIISFMDKSGSYQPEAVEMDKHILEFHYQNNGYLAARVTDVDVVMGNDKQFTITFHIDEGDFYSIKDVHAPGNDLLSEEDLLPYLPIKPGDPYSKDKISKSIEMLRNTWGEFGYIFCDINPRIIPDEQTKEVSITFNSELGNKIFANRISISGNKKTRDKIIRRQLLVNEGDLITNRALERSKDRVEMLGFFDRKKGVNWKTIRIDDTTADLDLLIEEIKTGRVGFQLGTGGDPKSMTSPAKGFSVNLFWADTNAFGQGWQYNVGAEWARVAQSFNFNLANPWMFDRPIHGAFDFYLNRADYRDEVANVDNAVKERVLGGSFSLGFINSWYGNTSVLTQVGVENHNFANKPIANRSLPPVQRAEFQAILDRRFLFGTFGWLVASLGQDVRNHPMHPTKGWQWSIRGKVGISDDQPLEGCLDECRNFGFYRFDLDTSWYTPLIGNDILIFAAHAHVGLIRPINERNIPFRELFHIGGPATVRGFNYGQIGPFWRDTSVGAQNAFWVNTELIFPLSADYSTKAAVFYDGGAGWDTPDGCLLSPNLLSNNEFNYRHSIGFSFRMLKPTPMRIDWGFKLDRNRRRGESTSEVHFGAYREF